MKKQSVVLLTNPDKWGDQARDLAYAIFGSANVRHEKGRFGDPLPDGLGFCTDVMLSFLCPWVIPRGVIDAHKLAINFHPGSTNYPGIGCYNFALYEGASEYGAVAHHMAAKVDTGPIIMERKFLIGEHETVETLRLRTVCKMLDMFHDIASDISVGRPLQSTAIKWKRQPFTRKQLNELCHIDIGQQDPDEITRRVRATKYPGAPGAEIKIGGVKFTA